MGASEIGAVWVVGPCTAIIGTSGGGEPHITVGAGIQVDSNGVFTPLLGPIELQGAITTGIARSIDHIGGADRQILQERLLHGSKANGVIDIKTSFINIISGIVCSLTRGRLKNQRGSTIDELTITQLVVIPGRNQALGLVKVCNAGVGAATGHNTDIFQIFTAIVLKGLGRILVGVSCFWR